MAERYPYETAPHRKMRFNPWCASLQQLQETNIESFQKQMGIAGSSGEDWKVTAAFMGAQAHWFFSDLPTAFPTPVSGETDGHTVKEPCRAPP